MSVWLRTCDVPAATIRSSSAAMRSTLGTPSSPRRRRSFAMRSSSASPAECGTHGPPYSVLSRWQCASTTREHDPAGNVEHLRAGQIDARLDPFDRTVAHKDVRRSLKAPPPAAAQQHVRQASPASTSRRRRARSGPPAGHSASRAAGGHDGKLNAREPQARPAAYAGRINVHRRAVHLPSVSFPSIRSVGLVIGPMDPELRVQHLRSVPAPRLALGGGNEPCSPGAIAVRLAANELHPCACTSVVDHLWRGAYLASDDAPETRLKGPGRAHLRHRADGHDVGQRLLLVRRQRLRRPDL
jgi:hypothetical protein